MGDDSGRWVFVDFRSRNWYDGCVAKFVVRENWSGLFIWFQVVRSTKQLKFC